jgi:hypothetical protein
MMNKLIPYILALLLITPAHAGMNFQGLGSSASTIEIPEFKHTEDAEAFGIKYKNNWNVARDLDNMAKEAQAEYDEIKEKMIRVKAAKLEEAKRKGLGIQDIEDKIWEKYWDPLMAAAMRVQFAHEAWKALVSSSVGSVVQFGSWPINPYAEIKMRKEPK